MVTGLVAVCREERSPSVWTGSPHCGLSESKLILAMAPLNLNSARLVGASSGTTCSKTLRARATSGSSSSLSGPTTSA